MISSTRKFDNFEEVRLKKTCKSYELEQVLNPLIYAVIFSFKNFMSFSFRFLARKIKNTKLV